MCNCKPGQCIHMVRPKDLPKPNVNPLDREKNRNLKIVFKRWDQHEA